MANDPQVPWTDEQWARVNQVIQEEAKRARVAATFLPLYGPLSADSDYVREQGITYPPMTVAGAVIAGRQQLNIDDRDTMRLATLQVTVPVRNAQMADPEMSSVLALFRRAANVVARLEDAVVFRGLVARRIYASSDGDCRSPQHLANHRRERRERALVNSGPSSSVAQNPVQATPDQSQSPGHCGIRGHWPIGGPWTLRSVCHGPWSKAVCCRADPRPGVACLAAGPDHPVSRRRSAAAFLDARRVRRIQRRSRGARRRAARTRRRHRHMPPVPAGYRSDRRSSSGCPRRLRFASGSLTRSSNFICM